MLPLLEVGLGSVFEEIGKLIEMYSADQLKSRNVYEFAANPELSNSTLSGIFKIVDFRMTPVLFGLVLVSVLAVSRFPTKNSEKLRRWAISSIPIFFAGLIFQFLGSAILLARGFISAQFQGKGDSLEFYFSFSQVWFGADVLHIVVPLASVLLALILWYVLKRNHYEVYRRNDAQAWWIIRYFLLSSIFVFQRARNMYSTVTKVSRWIYLDGCVSWFFNLPIISFFKDFFTTPPYMSVIGSFDSVIFSVLFLIAIQMILPVIIKRIVKFVYRYLKIKDDKRDHGNQHQHKIKMMRFPRRRHIHG